MDTMDHLMAEKNKNNNDSQKDQVTPKKNLKKTIVQIKFSECADAYGNDLIADQMICAGEAGKDSCQVYSGQC